MPARLMLIAAILATTHLARAAERHATLAGPRLTIDGPCARDLDIQPDPGLHDQAVIAASAEHEEELDHLLMEGGAAIRLHTKPGDCWRPSQFGTWRPTLRLSIRVPDAFAVAIDESGAATYRLGAIGGRLTLELSGANNVTAQTAADLTLDLSGMGHIHVATVRGAAKLELSGGGDVTIDTAHAPTLSADLSGAGALTIAAGEIGTATVESSGFGNVRIGAVVDAAHVDLSGMGSVHFTRVTGQLEKEVSGMGNVTVGQ